MKFDYKEILKLKPDDVIILNDLKPLAERAKEIERMINETYLFRANESSLIVWNDFYNEEYFTHYGVWQARYVHQTYDIRCTAEEIFEYMKAEYLVRNGFIEDSNSKEVEMSRIYGKFQGFVNRTEELYKAKGENVVIL